jgi:hypothetical protein
MAGTWVVGTGVVGARVARVWVVGVRGAHVALVHQIVLPVVAVLVLVLVRTVERPSLEEGLQTKWVIGPFPSEQMASHSQAR